MVKSALQPITISAQDDDILRHVYFYHVLNAEQITKLLNLATVKFVRDAKLTPLAENDYLYRFREPTAELGSKPFLYRLGSKGISYLKDYDLEFLPKRFVKNDEVLFPALKHNLLLNDWLIAASLLTYQNPDITIEHFRHEWQLRRTPLTVKLKEGVVSVVPDGFIDFRIRLRGQIHGIPIWTELDMGSEHINAFKKKIRGIMTAITTDQYEKLFHAEAVTIAIATTVKGTRLANLRKWIFQELEELGRSADCSLFLLTQLPEGDLNPRDLFFGNNWIMPHSDELLPLLDLS